MRILSGIVLSALAGALQAEVALPWWLGVGAGIGEVEVVGHDRSTLVAEVLADAGVELLSATAGEDDATRTLSLAVGYRFTPYLGASIEWQDLGSTEGSFVVQPSADPAMQLQGEIRSDYTAWSLAGTGYWPLLSWLSLQGRLGMHYWHHEFELRGSPADTGATRRSSDAGIGALLGAGIGFTPLPWLGFDFYWQRFHGIEDEAGIDVKSLSVVFRF